VAPGRLFLPHNGRLLRPLGSRAFPIYPGCDAPGSNAVIGGLMPGDLTLDLFQRLPAKLLGQSAGLLSGEGSFGQKT
jgi:hypothetical protein